MINDAYFATVALHLRNLQTNLGVLIKWYDQRANVTPLNNQQNTHM